MIHCSLAYSLKRNGFLLVRKVRRRSNIVEKVVFLELRFRNALFHCDLDFRKLAIKFSNMNESYNLYRVNSRKIVAFQMQLLKRKPKDRKISVSKRMFFVLRASFSSLAAFNFGLFKTTGNDGLCTVFIV